MRVKKNARAFVPEEVFDRKTLLLSNQKENVKRLKTASLRYIRISSS